MWLSIIKKLKIIYELVSLTRIKVKETGDSLWVSLIHLVKALTVQEFSPVEVKVYTPHLASKRRQYPVSISKETSLRRLARYNKREYEDLTEDKMIFYRRCIDNGIPVPQYIFTTKSDDHNLQELYQQLQRDKDDSGLLDLFPDNFIIKERDGAFARGFEAFHKVGCEIFSATGEKYDLVSLLSHIDADDKPPMLVQERLFCHTSLAELTGNTALQGARLPTVIKGDDVRPLYLAFKLLGKDNLTDNFSFGKSGNLFAFGDKYTGIIQDGLMSHPSGMGLLRVNTHPDTGKHLKGFQIPFWPETLELVAQAHRVFSELEYIGWDVGITNDGPKLLEGNMWFDPPLYATEIMDESDWLHIFGEQK